MLSKSNTLFKNFNLSLGVVFYTYRLSRLVDVKSFDWKRKRETKYLVNFFFFNNLQMILSAHWL